MSETRPEPMIEQLPETRVGSRWLYNYAAQMMKLGAGDEQMLTYLTQQGLDRETALGMMDEVRKAQKPKQALSAKQFIEKAVRPASPAKPKPAVRSIMKPMEKSTAKTAAKPALTQTDYLIDMILGGAVCVLGFIIVIVSISTARNGAAYFLACGAMTFGALRFYRGFVQFRNKQG